MLPDVADLRLVADQLVGQPALADADQLERALDVGEMVDRYSERRVFWRKARVEAKRFAGDEAVGDIAEACAAVVG